MRGEIITHEEMLAIPAYEVSDLTQIPSEPLVSVIVITYNHEAFLEQTIQGILEQQCDFPIELIIGEDKSTDRTLEICLEYQKSYPQVIRIVTWHENVGANANFLRCWGRARGKYVAICEGDDYWIDPAKLTKQVALMEESPGTTLSGAQIKTLPPSHIKQDNPKLEYYTEEIFNGPSFHTSTFIIRVAEMKIPACAYSVFALDYVLKVAAALQGSLRCVPDTTSVYRIHADGIYTELDDAHKHEREIAALQAISSFADEKYFPVIRKRMEIVRIWLCHELAANGQLSRARRLAWGTLWPSALNHPKQTLVLIFRLCLPRTFRMVFNAWNRCKQPFGAEGVGFLV